MTDFEIPVGPASNLKQKLLEALQKEALKPQAPGRPGMTMITKTTGQAQFSGSAAVEEEPLPPEFLESQARLQAKLRVAQQQAAGPSVEKSHKPDFDDTLSMRGVVPRAKSEHSDPAGRPTPSSQTNKQASKKIIKLESVISGGSMADLSGYKDLSKAPMSFGDDDLPVSSIAAEPSFDRGHHVAVPQFQQETLPGEVDTEFSGNVKTLIRLVNELPEGVTKQTGAQIIRLTMEAMGISMEDVLSEAQSAQSEMLDAVRANIKKIEEYKTVIRKLETDIKYYQGKANELSEIIDLFILSNTSSQRVPSSDDLH